MAYTKAEAKAFAEMLAPAIKKYSKECGYKLCSPAIAQAIKETGCGKDGLSPYGNYFGLKAGSSKKGAWGIWDGTVVSKKTKEEYTPGTLTSINAYFRVFKADDTHTLVEKGVHGYYEFLNYKRYAKVKDCTTPYQYFCALRDAGYFTSTTYVSSATQMVEDYELWKYDDIEYQPKVQIAKPTLRKGDTGTEVKILQKNLNSLGVKVVVDGQFGDKTEKALMQIQEAYKIGTIYDGVYGNKSYTFFKSLLGGN